MVDALTGRFDEHHADLARMPLDQIDALTAQIGTLTARIDALIAAMPAAQGRDLLVRDRQLGPAPRRGGRPVGGSHARRARGSTGQSAAASGGPKW